VALVGVGHELCGDDGVGPVVARALRSAAHDDGRLLVVDAGPAPESYSGVLRRFAPDLVLLVDAAQMDAPPGTVRWLDWQAATGLSASTHTLPLRIFGDYLIAETGCHIGCLGIQPASNDFGAALSPAVRDAAEACAQSLAEILAAK
jgi:hydrogenase maturation protease HycI